MGPGCRVPCKGPESRVPPMGPGSRGPGKGSQILRVGSGSQVPCPTFPVCLQMPYLGVYLYHEAMACASL